MTSADNRRALKVGLLVAVALVVLGVGIFVLGEKNNLFSPKNEYFASFVSVSGLNPGNPVQLNGVKVGSVKDIVLPEDPGKARIRVEISVDRRYAQRVRTDSVARIQSLGLLGDKYVEITSGSPGAEVIASGAEIPSSEPPGMDSLMTSGRDVITDVTAIAASLRQILEKVQGGEGLLGELVADREAGRNVIDAIIETADSVREVAAKIEHGEGALPRLITDAELADRLEGSLARLETFLIQVEEGEGLVPALMTDPETRQRFETTLASLETSSANLAAFSEELRGGRGVLPRLISDEEYGDRITEELEQLLSRLNLVADKIEGGDGTAAQLINDPQVYEALNDIIVGVNESRLLRWLIRNRQKAGIEKRYHETVEAAEAAEREGRPPSEPER